MFDHMSMTKAKAAYTRMSDRIQRVKKENEKAIERGLQVVETAGSMFGWGWANHRYGTVSATDASSQPEVQIMGMPADLGAGLLLLGAGFFGAFGRYDEHAINLGTGSLGSFAYRWGSEIGDKAHHTAAAAPAGKKQVTSGYGRVHNVVDERERQYA